MNGEEEEKSALWHHLNSQQFYNRFYVSEETISKLFQCEKNRNYFPTEK
jgi:hypothetical protein